MTYSQFFLSVLSSLIASFMFLMAILILLRPAIRMSNCIVLDMDDKTRQCYRIKFYNKSFFSAYDADISLVALEERPAEPRGRHIFYEDIELGKSQFSVIFRWLPMFMTKNYAHNCTQIKTYQNLDEILKHPNKTLQMKITLRHGLTGLSKTFIKNYHTDAVIETGTFAFGNSFEVIKKRA